MLTFYPIVVLMLLTAAIPAVFICRVRPKEEGELLVGISAVIIAWPLVLCAGAFLVAVAILANILGLTGWLGEKVLGWTAGPEKKHLFSRLERWFGPIAGLQVRFLPGAPVNQPIRFPRALARRHRVVRPPGCPAVKVLTATVRHGTNQQVPAQVLRDCPILSLLAATEGPLKPHGIIRVIRPLDTATD